MTPQKYLITYGTFTDKNLKLVRKFKIRKIYKEDWAYYWIKVKGKKWRIAKNAKSVYDVIVLE